MTIGAVWVLAYVAKGALFRPSSDCNATVGGDALIRWNHMLPGAQHNVDVLCSSAVALESPNGSLTLAENQRGIELQCSDAAECNRLVSEYVVPITAQTQSPLEQVAAAAKAIGVMSIECTTTADCNHPAAVCQIEGAGVGYCAPGPVAAPVKSVCHDGLHASCNELIVAASGFAGGFVIAAIITWAKTQPQDGFIRESSQPDALLNDVLKIE